MEYALFQYLKCSNEEFKYGFNQAVHLKNKMQHIIVLTFQPEPRLYIGEPTPTTIVLTQNLNWNWDWNV